MWMGMVRDGESLEFGRTQRTGFKSTPLSTAESDLGCFHRETKCLSYEVGIHTAFKILECVSCLGLGGQVEPSHVRELQRCCLRSAARVWSAASLADVSSLSSHEIPLTQSLESLSQLERLQGALLWARPQISDLTPIQVASSPHCGPFMWKNAGDSLASFLPERQDSWLGPEMEIHYLNSSPFRDTGFCSQEVKNKVRWKVPGKSERQVYKGWPPTCRVLLEVLWEKGHWAYPFSL